MTIRYPETVGTSGADSFNGVSENIYFGLGGADMLRSANNSFDVFLAGGSGNDAYTAGDGSNIVVIEGGGNADTLTAGDIFLRGNASDDTFAAEIDGEHLMLLDDITGQALLIADWENPARRIESFVLADGTYTFAQLRDLVVDLRNFEGDVDFEDFSNDGDELREALDFYIARASELEGTTPGAILGTPGDDVLTGTPEADIMQGLEGNDRLVGSAGPDRLDGGAGNDTADYTNTNVQVILNLLNGTAVGGGAAGDSLVSIEAILLGNGPNRIVGSNGAERIVSGSGADELSGADSNDVVEGGGGADLINGDAGNDTLIGGTGDDVLLGGAGVDSLLGGDGVDRLVGGAGADQINGGNGADFADYRDSAAAIVLRMANSTVQDGNGSTDTLTAVENVYGSEHADDMIGDSGFNRLFGFGGADTLAGGNGPDGLEGMDGDDRLTGGNGDDLLAGGNGDDTIDGGAGIDVVEYTQATAGVSVFMQSGGNLTRDDTGGVDTIISIEQAIGGGFNDTLRGSTLDDEISGLGGNDALTGGAGDDLLQGGAGNDTLDGGAADDVLYGGSGIDLLTGGAGADRFIFLTDASQDRILDFVRAQGDRIDLSDIDADEGLAGNQAFSLIGTAAFSGDAGELRYQANGAGTGYIIEGDDDGNAVADVRIEVITATAPIAADFLL